MRAVTDLLKMMDDATFDAATRSWVFQALRDITGAVTGSDPAAWGRSTPIPDPQSRRKPIGTFRENRFSRVEYQIAE